MLGETEQAQLNKMWKEIEKIFEKKRKICEQENVSEERD